MFEGFLRVLRVEGYEGNKGFEGFAGLEVYFVLVCPYSSPLQTRTKN